MTLYSARIDTPIGALLAAVDGEGALVRLAFPDRRAGGATEADGSAALERAPGTEHSRTVRDEARCAHVARQLDEYFGRRRTAFELPLAPRGTAFQRAVWDALGDIPFGRTLSYGELAVRVGGSARAVGRANATNPIAIVVPCHRVIGADGSLTGYGGGLDRKRFLLEHEGALTARLPLS